MEAERRDDRGRGRMRRGRTREGPAAEDEGAEEEEAGGGAKEREDEGDE